MQVHPQPLTANQSPQNTNYFSRILHINLSGDLFHQDSKEMVHIEEYVHTFSEAARFGPFKRFLYRALDHFSEKFVDYFLVVSSVLEKAMIQDHGIPREKVLRDFSVQKMITETIKVYETL